MTRTTPAHGRDLAAERPGLPTEHPEHRPLVVGGLADVPAALRHVRHVHRLSQRGLAKRLAVSKALIARLEQGDLTLPADKLLGVLADIGFMMVIAHPPEATCLGTDQRPTSTLCEDWLADGDVEHRDRSGRRFPAHAVPEWSPTPPDYWYARNDHRDAAGSMFLWHQPPFYEPPRARTDPRGQGVGTGCGRHTSCPEPSHLTANT